MKIIKELTLDNFVPWSGAVETLTRIKDEDKLEQLESILEDLYPDGIGEPDLNDLLWFDDEQIFEWLGIEAEEEED